MHNDAENGWIIWMNDWCFRPRFCTVKAILGRRQPGWIIWNEDTCMVRYLWHKAIYILLMFPGCSNKCFRVSHDVTKYINNSLWYRFCCYCCCNENCFYNLLFISLSYLLFATVHVIKLIEISSRETESFIPRPGSVLFSNKLNKN